MKIYLTFFLLTYSIYCFSQKEGSSLYFPQEQLIHPKCINTQNKNACLKDIFTSEIRTILLKYIHKVQLEKDTLNLSVRFCINKEGEIDDGYKYIALNEKKLEKKAGKKLELIFSKMPTMKVENKKLEKYNTFHLLHISFVSNTKNGKTTLEQISTKSKYTGGFIEEKPIYPGCEDAPIKTRNQCFNQGVQQHLAKYFRYPKKAQRKKIQGRVNIMFRIDETGNVYDIKTRGPNPILEKEAARIITLFPKCAPGTLNGKPVSTAYSVPLNFKLK